MTRLTKQVKSLYADSKYEMPAKQLSEAALTKANTQKDKVYKLRPRQQLPLAKPQVVNRQRPRQLAAPPMRVRLKARLVAMAVPATVAVVVHNQVPAKC